MKALSQLKYSGVSQTVSGNEVNSRGSESRNTRTRKNLFPCVFYAVVILKLTKKLAKQYYFSPNVVFHDIDDAQPILCLSFHLF